MAESNRVRVGFATSGTKVPTTIKDVEEARRQIAIDIGNSLNHSINALDDARRRLNEINPVCQISLDLASAAKQSRVDLSGLQRDLNQLREAIEELFKGRKK